jgi:hypothetical protein
MERIDAKILRRTLVTLSPLSGPVILLEDVVTSLGGQEEVAVRLETQRGQVSTG